LIINGKEYIKPAEIKEALQWPVGNFDMQKNKED
jgi:hypothetical protein